MFLERSGTLKIKTDLLRSLKIKITTTDSSFRRQNPTTPSALRSLSLRRKISKYNCVSSFASNKFHWFKDEVLLIRRFVSNFYCFQITSFRNARKKWEWPTSFRDKAWVRILWFWKIDTRNSAWSPKLLVKNIKDEPTEANYAVIFSGACFCCVNNCFKYCHTFPKTKPLKRHLKLWLINILNEIQTATDVSWLCLTALSR